MNKRVEQLKQRLQPKGLRCALVTSYENRLYLSGFTGSNATLLICEDENILITDFRYQEQAAKQAGDFTILITSPTVNVFDFVKDILAQKQIDTLGFEAEQVTVQWLEVAHKALEGVHLIGYYGEVEALRAIKDASEIAKIQKAQDITDAAFLNVLNILKPGVSEVEIAAYLCYDMARNGCRESFPAIVASGPNGSMPHAVPSERKLEQGDFVTMDFGCIYDSYCSDMTRTVAIGQPSDEMVQVYEIVLSAQLAALDAIQPGANFKAIDAIARNIITEAGYGECFGHGLGHGFGLAVHEEPRFSQTCNEDISVGVCISCEPGIYLPGKFGVRIEDTVAVTEGGYHNFTASKKELMIL
ncbi:Xaa-Pro peptidase family protein [Eubacteriales bacterium OttesenSCG-928-N14]|nr:Xaa-Pro peptidase family protein [Eubacteriales bacterium OttesenSCG-928-N14]